MNKYLLILKTFNWVLARQNLVNILTYNVRDEFYRLNQKVYSLTNKLRHAQFELLYFKVLDYFAKNGNGLYSEEVSFLEETGRLTEFPYPRLKTLDAVTCAIDPANSLPYVLHRGKKLYYPKTWSLSLVIEQYTNLVEKENIVGGGFSAKCPHQYQTDRFHVRDTDTVLDIGAAEGLFALDVIDSVENVMVIEADALWAEPLAATFAPYAHKAKIINKFISDKDSPTEITIESCLQLHAVKSLFIKMDIEGEECKVIGSNERLLNAAMDLRVVCCTYHNRDDATVLKGMLERSGYITEFSDGFVLFIWDENIQPPYFRHGLIRAKRQAFERV